MVVNDLYKLWRSGPLWRILGDIRDASVKVNFEVNERGRVGWVEGW